MIETAQQPQSPKIEAETQLQDIESFISDYQQEKIPKDRLRQRFDAAKENSANPYVTLFTKAHRALIEDLNLTSEEWEQVAMDTIKLNSTWTVPIIEKAAAVLLSASAKTGSNEDAHKKVASYALYFIDAMKEGISKKRITPDHTDFKGLSRKNFLQLVNIAYDFEPDAVSDFFNKYYHSTEPSEPLSAKF